MKLKSIQRIENNSKRYDIQTETGNFFANGILVHNCLIVSKFKGELIIRTRGTVDARKMANGDEIELLIKKYPKAFDNVWLENGYSICYEWTTPSNVIVLAESKEPELWLTGIIDHNDYSYVKQYLLDSEANTFGVRRGITYKFTSFEEMVKTVELMEGVEGVVVYSGDGQTLKKVKSLRYLMLHRLKDRLSSDENVVDYFLINGCKTAQDLLNKVAQDSDYEIVKVVEMVADKVEKAYADALWFLTDAQAFVENTVKTLPDRKSQAQAILGKDKARSGFMFMMLDGKIKAPFDSTVLKKLMMEHF